MKFAYVVTTLLAGSMAFGAGTKQSDKAENASAPEVRGQVESGKLEFDLQGSDIHGLRMNPLNSLIGRKSKPEYDFVHIRTEWYQEEVQSTTGLNH